MLVGTGLGAAMYGGLIPVFKGFQNIQLYATSVENILMLIAMGYRVYNSEKEKDIIVDYILLND